MSQAFIQRLQAINRLIRIRGTGSPKQFAKKLNISESSLYMYLSLMKDLGAPIAYSKGVCSYYYESDGNFIVGFIEYLEEMKNKGN